MSINCTIFTNDLFNFVNSVGRLVVVFTCDFTEHILLLNSDLSPTCSRSRVGAQTALFPSYGPQRMGKL